MKTFPKKYDKKEFNKFLIKYNVSDTVINKFEELPEKIERSGNTYKLDINVIWYNVGITHYAFEINYYSEELIEYLFPLKVYGDIELSINNMLCEIAGINCMKGKK
jgi:hypothetical protein